MPTTTVHLVRDVLDKQLVTRKQHDPMGRADGIVFELREPEGGGGEQPPRITAIQCGFPVLAARIHPRLGRWVQSLGRRFGVRRGRIYYIPITRVHSIAQAEVELAIDHADRTPATAWERWLREHIIRHIPGSGA
jgi:hypothetical protein